MADVMEDLSTAGEIKDVVNDGSNKDGSKVDAAPPIPKSRRSPVRFIVLGMLAIGLAVGGWAYFHFRDRISSDDAQIDGHIVAIAPKVSGNVVEVLVKDNQQVKAGDILVRIDPRDYQARVQMARAAVVQAESQVQTARTMVPMTNEATQSGVSGAAAQLADARAELDRARLGYEQASSSEIAVAEANVRSKQASNDRAQADLARMKPLLDKEEISRQQYDSYQAQARVAESELRAAQEQHHRQQAWIAGHIRAHHQRAGHDHRAIEAGEQGDQQADIGRDLQRQHGADGPPRGARQAQLQGALSRRADGARAG